MTQEKSNLPEPLSQSLSTRPNALWSRRRLLKELGRAHGAMAGLLIMPGAWSKPIMEFATVGALTTLSSRGGTTTGGTTTGGAGGNAGNSGGTTGNAGNAGSGPTCMTGTLTLPFPTNANPSVNFTVYWWGADATGVDISCTLNTSNQTLTFSTLSTALVSMVNSTISSIKLGQMQVSIPSLNGPFTLTFSTSATARTYNFNPSERITIDFTYNPGSSPSLALSNPKSSKC